MSEFGIQNGKSVWIGPELLGRKNEWIISLSSEEINQLKIAADQLLASRPHEGLICLDTLSNLDQNFNLSLILAKVKELIENLHNGLGFCLWRGIPVHTWTYEQCAAAFLLIGKSMGNLRLQNAKGHVLGHVTDLGLDISDPTVRFYQTRERPTFHADFCDVVGLLCLKTAKEGGLSSLVSAGTIYNQILKTRPDLLPELFRPFPCDRREEVPEGTLPFYSIPVYSHYEGYLSILYQRTYINTSQRFPQAPRLTTSQVAALDLLDSLAEDPKLNLQMELLPGDMQFVHNHVLLHDRTAYEDWPEPERKRHLLRLWLATPNARPLPPVFTQLFGSTTVGDRGGIKIKGVEPIAPLTP